MPRRFPQAWAGSRFRYTGQIALPEAQLYHYKARVYDPMMGRFLQTDPIGYDDGLNWYAYVGNDPLNKGDPDGLQSAPTCNSRTCFATVTVTDTATGQSTGPINIPKPPIAAVVAAGAAVVAGNASNAREKEPNYVYRGLSKKDNPSLGIVATNPLSAATPAQHVNGKIDTPWISTSKSMAVAAGKYGENGFVQIDLNKVPSQVVDVSNGIPGASARVNSYARSDQEVLVRGYIPPWAITAVQKFGQ